MYIVLSIFATLIGLILLLLIVALFIEKKYSIRREIIINQPKAKVFDYLKHIKNQNTFSEPVMADPNMKKEYRGTDGTVGFIYAWEGNAQAGKGEQEIKKIVEGELIEVELRFVKPFKGIGYAPFITETVTPEQTKVIWGMDSEMPYPMNAMMLIMNPEKMLGGMIEKSLLNLKRELEK